MRPKANDDDSASIQPVVHKEQRIDIIQLVNLFSPTFIELFLTTLIPTPPQLAMSTNIL